MSIRLTEIEPKTTKGGKSYVRAKASPGGWVSIWAPADIALVKEHGAGPYDGQTEKEGDFTNLSGLALAAAEPEPVRENAPVSNGHRTTGSETGWRTPEQIIRTDALREAGGHYAQGQRDVEPWMVLSLAQTYERYILTGEAVLGPGAMLAPVEQPPAEPQPGVPEKWMVAMKAEIAAADSRTLDALAHRLASLPEAERAVLVGLGRKRRAELAREAADAAAPPVEP